jgi:hypothetical protein
LIDFSISWNKIAKFGYHKKEKEKEKMIHVRHKNARI